MHGGRGEGALELVGLAHVPERDQRVGDRGADVGAHDHRDGVVDAEAPEATSPTITDVLADEDCTRTVPSSPTNSPASGLRHVGEQRSWVSAPMTLMPASSEDTPTRKM